MAQNKTKEDISKVVASLPPKRMETLLDAVPPQNLEAEQSLLGSLLFDCRAWTLTTSRMQPGQFYRPSHQIIFETLAGMYKRHEPVDIVTVQEALRVKGRLEDVGGTEYVMSLIDSVPSAANADYYAGLVIEKAMRRQLIEVATQGFYLAKLEGLPFDDILAWTQQGLISLVAQQNYGGFEHVGSLMADVFAAMEEAYRSEKDMVGLPTGLADLDDLTCGLQPKDLVLVAAVTGQGKSSFGLDIGLHNCLLGQGIGIFSLEMSKEQIGMRIMSKQSGLPTVVLHHCREMGQGAWNAVGEVMGQADQWPMWINDNGRMHHRNIMAQAQALVMHAGVKLLIVDYAQLVKGDGDSKVERLEDAVLAIKDMAKALNVPVLCLSQIKREALESGAEPKLQHLADCSALEKTADLVIFLHRQKTVKTSTGDVLHPTKVIVAKARQFDTGSVMARWNGRTMRLEQMTEEEASQCI